MFDYTTRLGLLASAVILVLGGQVFLLCSVRFSLRTCCESCTREGIVWAYLAVPLHQNRHWQ